MTLPPYVPTEMVTPGPPWVQTIRPGEVESALPAPDTPPWQWLWQLRVTDLDTGIVGPWMPILGVPEARVRRLADLYLRAPDEYRVAFRRRQVTAWEMVDR
jgi:hypothetical protein